MQESKSIGADVNWGVRFKDMKDVGTLLHFVSYFLSYSIINEINQNIDLKVIPV